MKKILRSMVLLMMLLVMCATPLTAHADAHRADQVNGWSNQKVQLREAVRRLWFDHVMWTRSYIVSALAGAEDQEVVLARLLKNQQDIGDAIKPYYGEAAGNKLAELLREHILLAGKLLEALKQGNTADAQQINKEWYKNADSIAAFLASANPNWSEKTLKDLLYAHLQLVADAVTTRMEKNWEADIQAFDKGMDHIKILADVLSAGIIKQFPDQFR